MNAKLLALRGGRGGGKGSKGGKGKGGGKGGKGKGMGMGMLGANAPSTVAKPKAKVNSGSLKTSTALQPAELEDLLWQLEAEEDDKARRIELVKDCIQKHLFTCTQFATLLGKLETKDERLRASELGIRKISDLSAAGKAEVMKHFRFADEKSKVEQFFKDAARVQGSAKPAGGKKLAAAFRARAFRTRA